MRIKTDAHVIETEAGTFYAVIVSAERTTDYDYDKRERVERITPRVWLATDPEFKGSVDKGHVKIRGRRYTSEYTYLRLPDNEGRLDRHGLTLKWAADHKTYNRGRRNDKGKQLDFETKAYGELGRLEVEALNRFEQDNPGWKAESIRRLFEYERDRAAEQAARLRQEAAKLDAEAAKWQARIDELAG